MHISPAVRELLTSDELRQLDLGQAGQTACHSCTAPVSIGAEGAVVLYTGPQGQEGDTVITLHHHSCHPSAVVQLPTAQWDQLLAEAATPHVQVLMETVGSDPVCAWSLPATTTQVAADEVATDALAALEALGMPPAGMDDQGLPTVPPDPLPGWKLQAGVQHQGGRALWLRYAGELVAEAWDVPLPAAVPHHTQARQQMMVLAHPSTMDSPCWQEVERAGRTGRLSGGWVQTEVGTVR